MYKDEPWWGGLGRGAEPSQSAAAELTSAPPASACRIHNVLAGGATNIGSGTLVDVAPDGRRGLVLTCGHLFTEGAGQIVVEFPDGARHGALLAAIDRQADLAALEIASPGRTPASLSTAAEPSGTLRAGGFGPRGEYRSVNGPVVGYSQSLGQESVRLSGAVRSGDSGGGVFDDAGRLCGVVWGEAGGESYASTGGPLRRFLSGLLGPNAAAGNASARVAVAGCPSGRCPLTPPPIVAPGASAAPPAARRPAAGGFIGVAGEGGILPLRPPAPAHGCDCRAALAALDRRLQGLEQPAGQAPAADRAASEAILPGAPRPGAYGDAARAAAMLATAALGLSGPIGWAIIAGISLGGWLVGRRVRRKKEAAGRGARVDADQPSLAPCATRLAPQSEAPAAADRDFPAGGHEETCVEIHQPIERDDAEARQLLRLSQLEGRDPLQDALAGRLALDRLDAIAESDAQPPRKQWADELRRELRDRFNEVAPTKFDVNADCELRIAE
ncbi:MAG: trypsin-like peptidase domain-containing protein [Pirellulales bacterium]|nr:trypsin-like peptidase domain-containing protein [Pirellulales bacterium]